MIICTKSDSSNRKLGEGVRATYRKVGETCPQECELLETGVCYAMKGPTAIHSSNSGRDENDGEFLYDYLLDLPHGKKVRHHVSGDFFYEDEPHWPYIDAMLRAHRERPDLIGWTYTHGWRRLDPDYMNEPESLTVNASCDNIQQAREAKALGWPVTVVMPEDAPKRSIHDDMSISICPYQTDGIECSDCQICFRDDRKTVVGFREH